MRALAATLLAWSLAAGAMVIDPVDPAFGVAIAEFARASNGAIVELHGIAVMPDGRVAALTVQEQPGPLSYCPVVTLVMFSTNGAIDTSFGIQGRAPATALGMPCATSGTLGFTVAPDGAFYIAASGFDAAAPGVSSPRIWKAKANGLADASFGSGGSALMPGVDSMLRPTLQILSDGSIAAGGTAMVRNSQGQSVAALAALRLRPNGTPDTGYGTQGVALAVPANRPIFQQEGGGMIVNADGTALVAGNIFDDDAGAKIYTDAAVARFDAQGKLDLSYGDAGFAIPLRDASTYAQSLAASNGEAYLAGIQNRDVLFTFVVRIKANGQLDATFGDGGVAGTDRFDNTNFDPLVAVDAARRVYYKTVDFLGRPRVTRLLADGRPDPDFGLDGSAYVAAEGWQFAGRGRVAMASDGHLYLGAGGFFAADGFSRTAIGVARLTETGGHRAGIEGGTAIVYYHQGLDHYFLTANPAEQTLLDNGTTVGWRRTGDEFRVVISTTPDAELSPVCRYYGRPEAHLDSHFFSAAPDECAAVAQKFSASWLLETNQAFQVHLPDRSTGACPRGSEKIYRAFNNRADANHYYGVLANAPAGWTYEGYGPAPRPTAFCAPLL